VTRGGRRTNPPSTMRAAAIREFGGPEVLRLEEIDVPKPEPGEVLVEVGAVTVNQTLDIGVREGRRGSPQLPHILGVDPVGIVVEAGHGTTAPSVGTRVGVTASIWCGVCRHCIAGRTDDCAAVRHIGVHRSGGYAEFVCVPVSNVHLVPDQFDDAETAVMLRHVPTAVNLLEVRAGLQAGETLVVMGAGGGLGAAGVQVGRAVGAEVIAVAGSTNRLEVARQAGADHVIDRRVEDIAARVKEITGGEGAGVVFDNTGNPETWDQVMASIGRGGRFVTAGAHGGGRVELDLNLLYRSRLRLLGGGGHTDADVRRALVLAVEGFTPAIIDSIYPLAEAAEAHRRASSGEAVGKVVIAPRLS